MTQTANYQLNQWESTDRILMSDFNADNAKIDAALAAGLKIAPGTYVGTGTYGADNPNTLTFDFAPKVVIISSGENGAFAGTVLVQGQTNNAGIGWYGNTYASPMLTVTWDDNTVTWYTTNSNSHMAAQYNSSGIVYHYAAIG